MIRPSFAILMACFLVGCGSSEESEPVVSNHQSNTVTDRQKLVSGFRTAEVFALPYSTQEFVIRDTNGCIWYANMNRGVQMGMAKVFDQFVSRPALSNDYVIPLLSTQEEKAMELFRIALQVAITNTPPITNTIYVTNKPQLEDNR